MKTLATLACMLCMISALNARTQAKPEKTFQETCAAKLESAKETVARVLTHEDVYEATSGIIVTGCMGFAAYAATSDLRRGMKPASLLALIASLSGAATIHTGYEYLPKWRQVWAQLRDTHQEPQPKEETILRTYTQAGASLLHILLGCGVTALGYNGLKHGKKLGIPVGLAIAVPSFYLASKSLPQWKRIADDAEKSAPRQSIARTISSLKDSLAQWHHKQSTAKYLSDTQTYLTEELLPRAQAVGQQPDVYKTLGAAAASSYTLYNMYRFINTLQTSADKPVDIGTATKFIITAAATATSADIAYRWYPHYKDVINQWQQSKKG